MGLQTRPESEYQDGIGIPPYEAKDPQNQQDIRTSNAKKPAFNAFLAFGTRLKERGCTPDSDTKIRIRMKGHARFYYPHMSVICQPNDLSETYQDQPVVIVEVLSDSTRRLDDGEKKDAYLTIPSLTHDILLEQDSPVAVVYHRADEHFERHEFTNLADVIDIEGLGLSLSLQNLYDGVLYVSG
jgi:Uma2 family endonuclease